MKWSTHFASASKQSNRINNKLEKLLHRTEKELLVFGYIRQNYATQMPIELIKLCFELFHDFGSVVWSFFTQEQFDILLTLKDKKQISNEQIILSSHINFRCTLQYPTATCKYVKLTIKPEFVNENIIAVIFYYEIFCMQSKFIYKDICSTSSVHKSLMKRDECVMYKPIGLEFKCCIDILQFKYKNKQNKCSQPSLSTSLPFSHVTNYKWNVTNKYIKNFKSFQIGKVSYTSLFGEHNCWCIEITKIKNNNMKLTLKLLGCLPNNNDSINMKYIFKICDLNGHYVKGLERTSFREINYSQTKAILWNDLNLEKLNDFVISVQIRY